MVTCVEICEECLERFKKQPDLFEKAITCGKNWVHYFEPFTRRESAHWKRQSSPKKQKVQEQSALGKVMFITFFNSCGLVYQHYVTPKTTVNKEYYRDVLEKPCSHISQK